MTRSFAILCLALSTLTACSPAEQGDPTVSGTAKPHYSIAVVPKGLGHQFWMTVKQGADAAGEDFKAEIRWNGPAKETEVAKQISIIQDMLNSNVDAVVMAACNEDALVETIKSAMDRGIPVVTIDSGVKSDLPVSFVATDNVEAAKIAARTLVGLIGGSGEVGLLPFVAGAATSEMREQGFKEGLKDFPDVELVATIHTNSDTARALAATEDMMTANPNLKGIFAANEAAAIGAVQALETAGKAGMIKLVAFDASPEQVAALKRGSMQALIVQDPFRMGYDGVKAAIDHIEGRPVEKRIDTGVTVVTLDNLDTPEVQKLINPTAVPN